LGRATISYTSKDYESIRKELVARIPQLTDRWTDFNKSDLGVVLLELFCGIGDMLAYYLDAQAAEAFLPTARQRQNVIHLCKLISYRLDGPVAATTTLRFFLATALDDDFVLPAGTFVRAQLEDGNVDFETVEDVTIPRGMLSVDVAARQGKRHVETFAGTGEPSQVFDLSGIGIAQGSIVLRVDTVEWTEVDHFQESLADSAHFQTDTDALDRVTVFFGDGLYGKVPGPGESIEVSYLETLGASGNLGVNLITQILTPLYLGGQTVPLSVTNTIPATGGSDRESLDHARKQAPAEVRSLWKGVTKEDYQALAEGFPGIAKAMVLDVNDCGNIRYYQVNMAIAPDGGGVPSALLKQDLADYLEYRKVITVEVNLFDPVYKEVSVDAEVYAYQGEDLDLVRIRVEDAVTDFFLFDKMGFGQTVHFSDIVALLDGIRGVSHVKMYLPTEDVTIKLGQIAVLGEMNIDVRRAD